MMKGLIKPACVCALVAMLVLIAACGERSNIPSGSGGGGGGGGGGGQGANSWAAVSFTGAPSARWGHSATWTGTEMIVWGGCIYDNTDQQYQYLKSGAKYNPVTDSWSAMNEADAPAARYRHTVVWTGTTMIVWGGYDSNNLNGFTNTGAIYNPAADSWSATTITGAPTPRVHHSAVWTGTEMIIWGGNDYDLFNPYASGGRYNPALDAWQPVAQVFGPPTAREGHFAFWTGTEMVIWGGYFQIMIDTFYLNSGAKYDPTADAWVDISQVNAPTARVNFSAVWTGSRMIVWGGYFVDNTIPPGYGYLNTGGIYNPAADSWTETSLTGAPEPRDAASAVWTGTEMIVWGGYSVESAIPYNILHFHSNGARYNPGTNAWSAISAENAPVASLEHSAVWTGKEMIIWGGLNVVQDPSNGGVSYTYLNSGAKYKP